MSKQNLSVALAIKNNNFYAESEEEFIMLFLRNLFRMFLDSKGNEGLSPFDETLIKLIQTKDFNSLSELEQEKLKNIFFKASIKGFSPIDETLIELMQGKNFNSSTDLEKENFKNIFSRVSNEGIELNFNADLEGFGYSFENLLNVLFENFKKLFSKEGGIKVLKEVFKDEEDFKEYVKSNIESEKVEGVICLIEVPNAEQFMGKLQKTGSTYQINFETIGDEYSFSSKGEVELMFLG